MLFWRTRVHIQAIRLKSGFFDWVNLAHCNFLQITTRRMWSKYVRGQCMKMFIFLPYITVVWYCPRAPPSIIVCFSSFHSSIFLHWILSFYVSDIWQRFLLFKLLVPLSDWCVFGSVCGITRAFRAQRRDMQRHSHAEHEATRGATIYRGVEQFCGRTSQVHTWRKGCGWISNVQSTECTPCGCERKFNSRGSLVCISESETAPLLLCIAIQMLLSHVRFYCLYSNLSWGLTPGSLHKIANCAPSGRMKNNYEFWFPCNWRSNGIAAETEAETKIVNMAEVAMRLHPNMTRAVALSKLFQVLHS